MTALSVAPTYADDADLADEAVDPNGELLAELEEARAQLADYRAAFDAIALVCNAAAKGDLEPRVPHLGDGAVVSDVRKQLNQLLDLTDAFVRESSASLEYASSGRFYRRFLVRGMHGSFKAGADIINQATASMAEADRLLKESAAQRLRMADEFEHAVLAVAEHVAAAATEMEASSRGVANTADHTSSRAADAGRGANEAASGVASVAAAVEELVSTVGEIQRQAQESNTAGARAAEEAAQARETMRGLESAAHEIGQIVTVINAVSSQTRLLALNATIEAARAGTAGKGFAVVASEVKELAAQTASSTDQIAAQVAAIQEATAQAALAIDGVTNTVREISVGSEQIAQAVGEQRAATTEMSRNTQEVAQATNDVTRNVEQVTVGTSETSAAAEQMTAAASELSGLAEKLRTEVDLFLRNIRA